ncbi:MAG: hypothetical protein JNK37_08700 [Verrucomicrobiales bacterium]|nr:hypothetical protein [Verrucomicrobiales bacterium]
MPIDPKKATPAGEFPVATPLLSVAFDASGRFLLAGGRDHGLVAVDLGAQKVETLAGHDSWIGNLARAEGGLVISADYAGRVIAWDCAGSQPEVRWTLEAHPATIYALAVSPDGKSFATADRDGLVRVWHSNDGTPAGELPRIAHPAYGVALHPDGKRVVTADRQPQKPRLLVHDLASGRELLAIEVAQLSGYRRVEDIEWGGIRAMILSPDGGQIVACGRKGYDGTGGAIVFDTTTGKEIRQLASPLKGGFCYGARFFPQDGSLLTVGGDLGKGELRFWGATDGTDRGAIEIAGPGMAFDLHPDGRQVAVAMNVGKGSYPDSGRIALYRFGG